MTSRALILAVFCVLALPAIGAPLPPPQDLPTAIQRQVAARATLKTQADDGQIALRKWYESALDAVRKDAASKADLDLVLATDAERTRMDRELTPEETAALPNILRDVRAKYDQARAQRVTLQRTALAASLKDYVATLDTIEKGLTRKLDVDGALAARKERLAAGEEITALLAPTVAGAGAPTRSGPMVRPTTPADGGAPVVRIAASLKAYGTIQNPSDQAIPFEMPDYAQYKGGRGVMLKNDPGAGKSGSTWSAVWTYSPTPNSGLIFIHPIADRQIIVRVRAARVEPVIRSMWEMQPFTSGGSTLFFKDAEAMADVMPLKPDQKYLIVSQLDASGHYTLSIDGRVVKTGDYMPGGTLNGYAFPLTLPESAKGEGLPLAWEAGYAGLIVGATLPSALNQAEDITFQASAPAAPPVAAGPMVASGRPIVPPSVNFPSGGPPMAVAPQAVAPPAAVTPATPIPLGRATPPAIHATSLAASGSMQAQVVLISPEVKAFGTTQSPVKDAIPFETPGGFDRSRGGRGIMIKNESGVGRNGSTWSVAWTFHGFSVNGLTFVHPFRGGHAVFRVRSNGVEPVSKYSWESQPMMAGGSRMLFKDTPAADDFFPLKPDRKYQLMSQLDSKGHYTFSIDGRVVQAGGFNTPSDISMYTFTTPLTLSEGFKGEGLPMKWKPGYAAFMVGPVMESSAGSSVCENLTFQGSTLQPEKAK